MRRRYSVGSNEQEEPYLLDENLEPMTMGPEAQ